MATLATVATVANNAANNIFARINFMMGLSKHALSRNKGFPNATPHGFCQGCPPAQTMRLGGDKSCRWFLRQPHDNDGTRHDRHSNSRRQTGRGLQKCAIVIGLRLKKIQESTGQAESILELFSVQISTI